jgi:Domain of unknown function (DUF4157)
MTVYIAHQQAAMFAPLVAKPQTTTSASSARNPAHQRVAPVAPRPGRGMVEQAHLPGNLGNQAMIRLLAQRASSPTSRQTRPPLYVPPLQNATQPRLVVGQINDPLEHEADRVAAQVLAAPAYPAVSGTPRQISGTPRQIQRVSEQSAAPPAGVDRVPAGSGMPLDPALRQDMEQRFGYDFSPVRVHSDAAAEQSARGLNAHAYTAGSDIVFGAGQFAPETQRGRRLIAHELTHVVQQSAGAYRGIQRSPGDGPKIPGDGVASAGASPEADRSEPQIAEFWSAVAAVGVVEQARKMTDEAVAKLLKEQGPKLAELQENIDILAKPGWQEDLSGQTNRLATRKALEEERQKILDAYDPSVERSSRAPAYPMPFTSLPYTTSMAPLQGPPEPFFPESAPDIVPDKGGRFGKYGGLSYKHDAVRSSIGDAYAYDIETDMIQVANDLERIARAGYTEIHIATGTHGSPGGALDPEFSFLRQDARSIMETMQRTPGLKIIPYNMADPAQVAQFNAMQALAAEGKLPGGATIAAHCFSRTRVPDVNEGPAGPYGSVEVLDPITPLSAYAHGGFSAAFGALNIYGGLQDPNHAIGALKVAGGGAQVIGAASYTIGALTDSVGMVRFGSAAGTVGSYITAPLVIADVLRDMEHKFDPGAKRMTGEEAAFHGVNDAVKLAGIFYPEAVVAAVALNYVVKPVAEKASDYLTPMFMGAMSQAYGVPDQYLWQMQ